jgi:hypothetical protein
MCSLGRYSSGDALGPAQSSRVQRGDVVAKDQGGGNERGRRWILTGVGHGDLADFIRVEPDLALAALEHARGEPLLQLERHHLLCRR